MGKKIPYSGKAHPDQTREMWERVGEGVHLRLRVRALGERRAIAVFIGASRDDPHRNAGQLILEPSELAEVVKTFRAGCGGYSWRSDVEVIEEQ